MNLKHLRLILYSFLLLCICGWGWGSGGWSVVLPNLAKPVQYGIDFDGTDDEIEVANESNFDFDLTDTFSVSCWIKGTGTSGTFVSKMAQAAPYIGWSFGNGSD